MRLRFDSDLEYQQDAINAVADLFIGQTPRQDTAGRVQAEMSGTAMVGMVVANNLELNKMDIQSNMLQIQMRNGLAQTDISDTYEFDVEMETGTGKTYVYLRTIFELNKRYGFLKFIIIVPSLAIKEGVFKSIEIMREHFNSLYGKPQFRSFAYSSNSLGKVKAFGLSPDIQIMIITIDSFNKFAKDGEKSEEAKNVIYRDHDKLGNAPINFIRDAHPFVIVDEPQSVDNTIKARDAIRALNPLAIFRYSATFRQKTNLVYKLDAVDAYDLQLVKRIEVASFQTVDYHNKAYMKLISVSNKDNRITAVIEIDAKYGSEIRRERVTVKSCDDLFDKSRCRDIYLGYIVNDIYCKKGNEYLDFTSREEVLTIGKAFGDIDDDDLKRHQIRKTVEEHLDKELMLKGMGIKVLSLFFVDRVANYRTYDEVGNPGKGKYAIWLEEAYKDISKKPKYDSLFKDGVRDQVLIESLHNGYFSQDKKGKVKDTSGATQIDDDTYSLIMKDKERLLSFESPLKFIFSHSALREGWDNPNVFQICTLNETRQQIKKRQEIGRGLRLCVNQFGERVKGFEVNTLTVMANESYEDFCKSLQAEIEEDEGIKFGIIEPHIFAGIKVKDQSNSSEEYFGYDKSKEVYEYLMSKGYIDKKGKAKDSLIHAVHQQSLPLPATIASLAPLIINKLRKYCDMRKPRNTKERKPIAINEEVIASKEFLALWDQIKWRTRYELHFNDEDLIKACVEDINNKVVIRQSVVKVNKARVNLANSGILHEEMQSRSYIIDDSNDNLPDIVTYLANTTDLTRKCIVEILTRVDSLDGFIRNPQLYMSEVAKCVKSTMNKFIADGIKYTKIGDDKFYSIQELFEMKELKGYLDNTIESRKSVYSRVLYDSLKEKEFAEKFEKNNDIKLYVKLPSTFTIDTPLGKYNPDWAILMDINGEDILYFVVETKSGDPSKMLDDSLRIREKLNIICGKKHFEALGTKAEFKSTNDFDTFMLETARR